MLNKLRLKRQNLRNQIKHRQPHNKNDKMRMNINIKFMNINDFLMYELLKRACSSINWLGNIEYL